MVPRVPVRSGPTSRRPAPLRPFGRSRHWDRFTPYLLATPAVVLLVGLLAVPVYRMAIVSLQHYERAQLWGNQAG